ncbi:hypothetical protein [Nocardia sp. NPDC049526]|uniref:hypothetical protein n=1 Tax=Nocardia sp. NPDC049526 TaxID=3364316 RepID=UPI0037B27A56
MSGFIRDEAGSDERGHRPPESAVGRMPLAHLSEFDVVRVVVGGSPRRGPLNRKVGRLVGIVVATMTSILKSFG